VIDKDGKMMDRRMFLQDARESIKRTSSEGLGEGEGKASRWVNVSGWGLHDVRWRWMEVEVEMKREYSVFST
jgi:hypothetical protein